MIKNEKGLNFVSEYTESEYNDLMEYYGDNYEIITCVDYHKTLEYILYGETYEEQIERFVEQARDGSNSIDCEDEAHFVYSDFSLEEIISKFKEKEDFGFEEFQEMIISECYNYYEANVYENEMD